MDDKLSLIPEVFFDLIARFVPGAVFLSCICLVVPGADEWLSVKATGLNDVLVTSIALGCIWIAGLMLSIVSYLILDMYSQGYKAYPELLACKVKKMSEYNYLPHENEEKKGFLQILAGWIPPLCSFVEKLLGGPHMWFRKLHQPFDCITCGRIWKAIREKLCCEYGTPSFWTCFDYVRRYSKGGGPSVVKIFAEATCARSLMLGFIIIAIPAFSYHGLMAGSISLVFAVVSSAAFSHYRVQGCRRMLLALLDD